MNPANSDKGICTRKQPLIYGVVTVSEKGQIVIPARAREEYGIKRGTRLIVLGRKDAAGIVLIKAEVMDRLIEKIAEENGFFSRVLSTGSEVSKKKGRDDSAQM